jgi:hypothetical protein
MSGGSRVAKKHVPGFPRSKAARAAIAARPAAAVRAAALFLSLFSLSACSLEFFGDFKVVSVSITENGIIGTGRREIEIEFSKEVREKEAERAVRVESDASVEVAIRHRVSGARVVLEPERVWDSHERYWLIVEKDLKDVYGKELGREFCLPFQSTEELIPVSASLVSPEVRGGVVEVETEYIRVVFNAGVDRGSVERAFSIAPSVEGYFEWDSDRELVYRLTGRLKKNGYYTVSVGGGAFDLSRHAVKSFSRSFEYFPNRDSPAVERVVSSGEVIFDREDTNTYALQEGTYIAEFPRAEKDLAIVVYFSDLSAPIDRSTLRDGIRVSPHVDLREEWLDGFTVRITFAERLAIGGVYEVRLTRRIADEDGLSVRRELLLELTVNGAGSRFLDFYAGESTALDVGARLMIHDGTGPPAVFDVEKSAIVKGVDERGAYFMVPFGGGADESEIAVELLIDIAFVYASPRDVPPQPGFQGPGLPLLDRSRLQDSVSFGAVFGDNPLRGGIGSFEWVDSDPHRCAARMVGAGAGNVYRFSIRGGEDGVVDDLGNTMAEDVVFYFRLMVVAR